MTKHKPAPTAVPIHELIAGRWSPRAYSSEPVSREHLHAVMEAARWAPSGYNLQPWRFIVFDRSADEVAFKRAFGTLVPFNQQWNAPAPILIAVTAHISTDVAAAPLLWVLPLSLYLLTWVLVFQSRPWLPHRWVLQAQPVAIATVIVMLAVGGEQNLLLTLGGHQLCFFVIAMACHGELARTRPPAKYLTGFYVAL